MFGYENYIVDKIKYKDINWFPINRAISIPNDVDKSEVKKNTFTIYFNIFLLFFKYRKYHN